MPGLVAAALAGCALADLIFVVAAAPSLLSFRHLYSVLHLLLSSAVLYAITGVLLAGYLLVLYGFVRVFRYRPGRIASLIMVVSFPLYLLCMESIQSVMLGTYIGPQSPIFYVSILLSLLVLFIAAGLMAWIAKRVPEIAIFSGRRLGFGRLLLLFAGLFLIAGALFGRPMNVLGIIPPEDQRTQVRERVLEQVPEAPPGVPNIVVAIIECFRSDHFTQENAPFLWKLARENYYFSRYYVAAPATRPSVTSFFLSLYPAQHGCYNLAGGRKSDGAQMRVRVPESAVSFPRLLQDNGYRTFMVTSNSMVMDRVFGFEKIFSRFSATDPYRFRAPFLEPFYGFKFLERVFAYFRLFNVLVFSPEHSTTYFDGPRLNTTIRRELPDGARDPFLLYVHYIEPHAPYYAHPYRPMQVNLYLPSQRDRLLDYYGQELRAADRVIEDLYAWLDSTGQLENTWLFISADHGEEFHDHGNWGHGKSLYPEVVHVPAILVAPPGARRAREIDQVVENIDIGPTLVQLAGIAPDSSWEGTSLIRLLERGGNVRRGSEAAQRAMSQFDDGQVFYASIIEGDYQLILRQRHGEEHFSLFNLASDPGAATNLFDTAGSPGDSLVIELDRALQRLYETAADMGGGEEQVDEELMKQLKTLGYIE